MILAQVRIDCFLGKNQTSESQPSSVVANPPPGSQEISVASSSGSREQILSSQDFQLPNNFEVEFFKSLRLSIQMDFSEALCEIPINSTILESLKNFFTSENPFDLKVLVRDISKSIYD